MHLPDQSGSAAIQKALYHKIARRAPACLRALSKKGESRVEEGEQMCYSGQKRPARPERDGPAREGEGRRWKGILST